MSIAINPVFPVIGAQSVASDVALQPGTVIDATVIKTLEANFVRIAIANMSIDVLSEVPLQAGQTLQLSVSQTAQGVKLAIVPNEGGADNPLPALAGSTSGASSSVLSDDGAATNIAPNIAAPKIAQALDAPIDPRGARPLTNLEALAVSAAVQSAASKQASLAPLFANLSAAASSASLPPVLQQAASALLAIRPDLNGNISGDDIKAAFEKSGLFFEQSQSARAASTPASVASSPANDQPDLKAALIVFRQTVASWLDTAQLPSATPSAATAQQAVVPVNAEEAQAPQTVSLSIVPNAQVIETEEIMLPQAARPVADEFGETDAKVPIYSPSETLPNSAARVAAANAGLTSLQEILQAFPKGVQDVVHVLLENEANALPLNANTHQANTAGTNPSDTPPPFRGATPSAQPVAASSLGHDAEPIAVAKHLVSDADAAIARQTLLQVASLPDRVDMQGMRQDVNAPRWNFEIPFATSQGTAVAQFEISRDGGDGAVEASKRVWKARFSLNVEPSGPVHVLVSLSGDRASVRMWAERPATTAQLRANAPQLTHALREAALEPGDIVIGDGAPPQTAKPPAGHFLDRAL